MAPPTATADVDVDFVKLLEEELASCVMPEVSDRARASTEDIVRDIHKLLTGNGGPTRGLIFKQAATRVDVKVMKRDLVCITTAVDSQKERCDTMHDKYELQNAAKKGAQQYKGKVSKLLWDNKGFILVIALLVTFYTINSFRDSSTASAAEQRLTKLVDKKIEQFVMSKGPVKK